MQAAGISIAVVTEMCAQPRTESEICGVGAISLRGNCSNSDAQLSLSGFTRANSQSAPHRHLSSDEVRPC